jgi:hypothetical protein
VVAAWLEFGQGSGGGTGGEARRHAAHDACRDEQPDAGGGQEQRSADRGAHHGNRQHLPAADMVTQVAQRNQREQRAGDIGGEDHGDPERAEAHLLLVKHIERDGEGSAQHHDQQDPGRQRVAAAAGRNRDTDGGRDSHR